MFNYVEKETVKSLFLRWTMRKEGIAKPPHSVPNRRLNHFTAVIETVSNLRRNQEPVHHFHSKPSRANPQTEENKWARQQHHHHHHHHHHHQQQQQQQQQQKR